ncbi:hypothetical protein COOONC_12602 [Cooperia oncophora]
MTWRSGPAITKSEPLQMKDIPGTEGKVFNLQKRFFRQLPQRAKNFINMVYKYAFLQLDGKMTQEQSAQAVLKKYRRLSYKACKSLDEALFEDIIDSLGKWIAEFGETVNEALHPSSIPLTFHME